MSILNIKNLKDFKDNNDFESEFGTKSTLPTTVNENALILTFTPESTEFDISDKSTTLVRVSTDVIYDRYHTELAPIYTKYHSLHILERNINLKYAYSYLFYRHTKLIGFCDIIYYTQDTLSKFDNLKNSLQVVNFCYNKDFLFSQLSEEDKFKVDGAKSDIYSPREVLELKDRLIKQNRINIYTEIINLLKNKVDSVFLDKLYQKDELIIFMKNGFVEYPLNIQTNYILLINTNKVIYDTVDDIMQFSKLKMDDQTSSNLGEIARKRIIDKIFDKENQLDLRFGDDELKKNVERMAISTRFYNSHYNNKSQVFIDTGETIDVVVDNNKKSKGKGKKNSNSADTNNIKIVQKVILTPFNLVTF